MGLLALALPARAELSPEALVRLSSSVVKVEVTRTQGGYSLGSGVIIGADRVVTNCHVTRDARQVAVLQGGLRLPAQAQRVDAFHDLCVLRVRGVDATLAVALGRAGGLVDGQPVMAIGHTAGALQRSGGEVLALHRLDGARVIQSSNFFSSGASGGGLFDADKKLVGILSFRLRGGTAHYFAVPTEWLEQQLRDGTDEPVGPLAPTARAFWEQALDQQPPFLRAAVLERDGNWPALQSLATDWTRRDADDPEPWTLLGLALDRLGRAGESRSAFGCALALAPTSDKARTALAQAVRPAPAMAGSPAKSETTTSCRP